MKVLILGAGIIGMTSAYYLLRRGHQVLIVDRESAPGRVSSYMNGGQFSYSYAEPLASPALLRQLPGLLLQRHSALQVTQQAFPEILPWGLRFLGNCSAAGQARNTRRVLHLASLSRAELGAYVGGHAADFDYRKTGKLHLYRDPRQLQRAGSLVELKNAMGFEQEIWDARQCLAAEPALEDYPQPFAGGIYSPLDQSGDSFKLIQALHAECLRSGNCEFSLATEVEGLAANRSLVTGVQTRRGELRADAYLICAGAESPRLLRSLGLRLPIVPVKGYSLTVPALSGAPAINLTDTQHKIVFTRLGDRLRVAGFMEFAGWNRQVRRERIEQLLGLATKVLPKAGDYVRREASWAGLRPMTPDSVPLIGATRWPNLWLNTGQGMLGSTLAFGSARLVADLLDGVPSPLDEGDFRAERFA